MQDKPNPQDRNKQHERPSDLRKRNKRLEKGRDALKEKNKQKAKSIKKLRGTIDDAKESRNSWKHQCQQTIEKNKKLTADMEQRSKQLLEAEKTILEKDEQFIQLQQMFDDFKKKKT